MTLLISDPQHRPAVCGNDAGLFGLSGSELVDLVVERFNVGTNPLLGFRDRTTRPCSFTFTHAAPLFLLLRQVSVLTNKIHRHFPILVTSATFGQRAERRNLGKD